MSQFNAQPVRFRSLRIGRHFVGSYITESPNPRGCGNAKIDLSKYRPCTAPVLAAYLIKDVLRCGEFEDSAEFLSGPRIGR